MVYLKTTIMTVCSLENVSRKYLNRILEAIEKSLSEKRYSNTGALALDNFPYFSALQF